MPTEHTLAENLLRLQSATEDITDAIAEKGGTASYSDGLEAMASKILLIPTPQPILTTKSITSNGTYNASSDNADGYSSVTVNIPDTASVTKTGTFTSNSNYCSGGTAKSYGRTFVITGTFETQLWYKSTKQIYQLATITELSIPSVSEAKSGWFKYKVSSNQGSFYDVENLFSGAPDFFKSDFVYGNSGDSPSLQIVRYNSSTLKVAVVFNGGGSNYEYWQVKGFQAIIIC